MQLLRSVAPHVTKLQYLAKENSPALLTALGVTGTVVTAILTARSTLKATEIIQAAEKNAPVNVTVVENPVDDPAEELVVKDVQVETLSTMDKVKLVWPLYIPPVVSGVLTITSIVMANRISSGRVAALVASSAVTERAFAEYKEKVVEKIGEKKATDIRDEIAQDRVTANPVESSQVIMTGTGDVLCYDNLTGRYFTSSMEKLRGAENDINHQLLHNSHASLSEFYEIVGLPPTTFTESVGWCMDIPLKVQFSTTMSTDGRPCIAIDFDPAPKTGFDYLYE